MDNLPTCISCGAPSGMIGGYFIKGCNCGHSNQLDANNPNNINLISAIHSDNTQPSDIVYNTLKEIVAMECTDDNGNLDSFGKFPFAQAIKILSKRDDVSIISEKGPIIKAQWN